MKFLALFLTYLICLNSFAAPMGVSGQNQSNKYPSVLKTPNNQITDIGSSSVLYETGNKNRLVNPGFEHSTFSTGWNTSVTGTATITPAVETTSPLEGKKSGKYTCAGGASGGTCTIYQDVTTTHTPQGVAALYVKSDTAWSPSTSTGVQVFSRKDGANFQAKAVDVTSDKLFSVPVTLSNVTSTGVAAVITVAASQTIIVFLDEGYVGAADLKQDFSPVGPWVDYGVQTIGAVTTAPTKGTTVTDKVRCRINGQDYECEFNYAQSSAGTAGSGEYIFSLPTGVSMDSSRIAFTTATLGNVDTYTHQTSVMHTVGKINTGTSRGDVTAYAYSATQFRLQTGIAYTGYSAQSSTQYALSNTTESWKFTIKFPGAGLSSNYGAYSTTNADYGFSPCTLTGSWVTNATYTALCKRSGEMLRVKGKVAVTGAPTAAALTLTIPNSLTIDANKIPAADKEILGHGGYVVSGANSYRAGAYYNSSTAVAIETLPASSAQNHVQAAVSNTSPFTFASGDYVSFDFEVPVSGWDNSNIIIGQFNGLESCLTSLSCADTFSADVSSTGVVSNENIDWINGNAVVSNTSTYTLSYNSGIFTVAPNCSVVGYGNGAITWFFDTAITSSQAQPRGFLSGANTAGNFKIICQKTGADAVFKTARAVASDANLRSVGAVGVDFQQVVFGSGTNCTTVCSTGNCTICRQIGSKITSVSFSSTGFYNVNGIDGTKYSCSGSGANTNGFVNLFGDIANSTSSFARVQAGITSTNQNVSGATVTCVGIP